MQAKKIVHIMFSLKVGGAENMVVDICNEQSNYADVTLIIIQDIIDYKVISLLSKRVNIIKLKQKPPTRFPLFVFSLWYKLIKISPDIIHLHNKSSLLLFPKILPIHFNNIFFTVHDTGIDYGKEIKNTDKVFSISKSVHDDILNRLKINSIINYNGIDLSLVSESLKNTTKLNSKKEFRIVQVSRLEHKKKGQDIILKALALLKIWNDSIHFKLVFIGSGSSKEFLTKLAKNLGILDSVSFLGNLPKTEVLEILPKYDLLVQPSRYEGFGLTVVEAMLSKVPVLVSNIEGPMEVICNGEYGYSFETENAEDCAKKISKVIDDYSHGFFEEKVSKAHKYAIDSFDIRNTAKRYSEV